MKIYTPHSKGFSLVEMLIGVIGFLIITTGVYTVLQSQQSTQVRSIQSQAENRAVTTALDRFRMDAMLVDPNWLTMGLPIIFPHQGLGYGQNFYSQTISEESLSDGVTFLVRDPLVDYFLEYDSNDDLCIGSLANNSTTDLYDQVHPFADTFDIEIGHWILVFQNGQFALGIVEQIQNSGFSIRLPNADEKQMLHEISGNNSQAISLTTGLAIKQGVLSSSVDIDGSYTNDPSDNGYCFNASQVVFQKIGNPVSYTVEYATSDGQEKSATNLYLLNQNGQKKKMLTRVEYRNGTRKSQYLANIDGLEITYDLIIDSDGSIETNVGRSNSSSNLLDTQKNYFDDGENFSGLPFHYASNIISVNISLVNHHENPKDPSKYLIKRNTAKASIDAVSGTTVAFSAASYESSVTESLSLSKSPSNLYSENIGKPLFFSNTNSGIKEMIVPVARKMTNGAYFGEEDYEGDNIDDDGRIALFDATGVPVNRAQDGGVTDQSFVTFKPITTLTMSNNETVTTTDSKFFPSTVNTVNVNGTDVILVGGVSLASTTTSSLGDESSSDPREGDSDPRDSEPDSTDGGSTSVSSVDNAIRTPGIATIIVGTSSIGDLAMASNTGQMGELLESNGCSIGMCQWQSIDNSENADPRNDLSGLTDTSNIATTQNGNVLIIPTTKTSPTEMVSIYSMSIELVSAGTEATYTAVPAITRMGEINGTDSDRLITSVAERTVMVDENEYLPICKSRKLSCSGAACASPSNNGTLELLPISTQGLYEGEKTGITIAEHNYACNGISVSDQGDLLVSGRLTVLPVTNNQMKQLVQEQGVPSQLYLDDIAYEQDGNKVYADGFRIDPNTYENGSDPQVVGWRSGMSSVSQNGSVQLVATNTVRYDVDIEQMNVGIHTVDLPSSHDRVLVSIQTNTANINDTQVSSTYIEGESADGTTPATFIPGQYLMAKDSIRTTPTPLPSLGSAMSEEDWYQLFVQLNTPNGAVGLNTDMPILNNQAVAIACEDSYITTCP